MIMKKFLVASLLAVSVVILSSCLGVETKEYEYTFKTEKSGTGVITFTNIMSKKDNDKDVSMRDFAEVVTDYYEGDRLERDMPGIRNVKKELFEKEGVLCGKITFEFDSLESIKVFSYDKNSPYMINISRFNSEEFVSSNGSYGGADMPICFVEKSKKKIYLKTSMTKPDESTIGLVEDYRMWKKRNTK